MDKIKQYFQTKAISNSFLGSLWNPRWVKFKFDNPDAEDEEKSYFRVGSALDCLLTSPERWELDFVVIDAVRPYGLLGKFIDALPPGLTVDSDIREYDAAYTDSGYKMWIDKVVEKFWTNTDAVNYYKLTKDIGDGIIVLSSDEYETVTKAQELILANEFIRPYFINDDVLNIELLHQVAIYFEYRDEQCKALLDGIMVDHKNRTIQPFDLKTSRSVYDFPISYLQYGYYRQAAFYELAIYADSSPVKQYLNEGYTVKDFIFIVVENKKSSSHPAIIYQTTRQDLEAGLAGGYIGQKYYKGIHQLIDDYKYHKEHDYWELPIDLLKNEGRIVLDVFNK